MALDCVLDCMRRALDNVGVRCILQPDYVRAQLKHARNWLDNARLIAAGADDQGGELDQFELDLTTFDDLDAAWSIADQDVGGGEGGAA